MLAENLLDTISAECGASRSVSLGSLLQSVVSCSMYFMKILF